MKKTVYIFNCIGILDLPLCLKLYQEATRITNIVCNKYCCIFRPLEGKLWSRSGSAKNLERNILKYLPQNAPPSKIAALEIYDQPKESQTWELEKQSCGFYIDTLDNDSFNIYLVTSLEFTESQVVDLWKTFSKIYTTNYMVSFSLEARKDVEIYMYGRPIYPANENMATYYSQEERNVVHKLSDLRLQMTNNLESCFPLVITTNVFITDEQAYSVKKIIDENVVLFRY